MPAFSAPAVDRPESGGRRPLPPVDRALFMPPPSTGPTDLAPARRPLADGGLVFSSSD
jgi:hypothetical protein